MDARLIIGPAILLGGIVLLAVRGSLRAAEKARIQEEERLAKALGSELVAMQASAVIKAVSSTLGPAAPPSLPGPQVPPLSLREADRKSRAWAGALDPEQLEQGSLKHQAVKPKPAPIQEGVSGPLRGADLAGASPEHTGLISQLLAERLALPGAAQLEVLWVRSVGTHAVWCERRTAIGAKAPARELLMVVRVEGGVIAQKWMFG